MTAATAENPSFSEVVAQTRRPLTSLASRVLGDDARAEDVAQDALCALFREWDRVENPGGFARSAVFNRCRDVQRREIRAREKAPLLRPIDPLTAGHHPGASPYLADVVAKLSPEWREIIVLRFYGGHTMAEIAELTGRSIGTVKSGLHRALAQLRDELAEPAIDQAA